MIPRHFFLRWTLLLIIALSAVSSHADNYQRADNLCYTTKTDSYAQERLLLDVYYPDDKTDCPVVIWFHGGGLEAGQKEIPQELHNKGMVVVGVNYRLLPKVSIDILLDDAAEAVAWVMKNIGTYHGDPKKVFVTGHSAGGYISMMLCLNKAWLARYDIDADSIAAYIPFSGQAITHYSVRKMMGISPLQPTIDEYAPLYWVRNDCPPLVLICGDREHELYGRYDENAYLARMMKLVGHQSTYLYELDGYGHGPMCHPAFHILINHINRVLGKPENY